MEIQLEGKGIEFVDFIKGKKHCPTCGGLQPELTVVRKGKRYYFTCYKIEDIKTNTTIAETDYKKLVEFAKAESS